jgi:UMF1 family MFS transporter
MTATSADTRAIPRRAVASWVLYDLANTIFSMGVVSMFFSEYVRDSVGERDADWIYGLITALSMGIIFVISPLLGSMTDRARRRMPFLVWSTIICCGCTALLARGPFAISAILFVVANAAYQAGLQFYDALLPEVTTEENRGRISGIGVGVGYLGSYLALAAGFVVPPENKALLFLLIALLFLTFAIPCFLFVRDRINPRPRRLVGWDAVTESTRQTAEALRNGQRYPGLLRFLIGRVFYTDAINTVISYMFLYTINVSLSNGLTEAQGATQARLVMLIAITFAVVGGLVWGRLVDRYGPKRTLTLVLYLWMATFTLAVAIGLFTLPVVLLFVVASAAGVAMGGTWASDRPYMLRLTPPDRVGEFYGLYGMVGRFSAISGPILWAATYYVLVTRGGMAPVRGQAVAVSTLLAMVIISYAILRPVTDERRDWRALGALPTN